MHRRGMLGTLLLLLLPAVSQAQWSVVDGAANLKLWLQYGTQVEQYRKQIETVVNQYTQIDNQIRQIQYAYTTVQHGVQNLQRFNLNNATSLLGLYRELANKLAQAKLLGYQVGAVYTQAATLYPQITSAVDGRQLAQLQRQWAGAQREAGRVGVTIQALQAQHADLMQKNRDLMTKAAASQGNLDTLQALTQGQGLQTTQLISIEQQLAVQGRVQTIKALEEATMKEATVLALEEASATISVVTMPAGHILPLSK